MRRRRFALFFLFLNAMFQSFSAAGIIAILDLYMSDFMQFSDHTSNAISAAFIVVFSAIAPLGGWLSDKQFGNYRMQVVCQFIWVAGQAIVMVFTIRAIDSVIGGVEGSPVRVLVTIGLLILAVGYGLIQPMQSVFVADQFNEEGEENEKQRAASFSWYYFFQNAGNLAGESVNPQLRGTVSAFSAMLSITVSLVVGFVLFVAGKPFFVMRLSDREADAAKVVQGINEGRPQVPWLTRARTWIRSDDARVVWKISKVYLILTGLSLPCAILADVCSILDRLQPAVQQLGPARQRHEWRVLLLQGPLHHHLARHHVRTYVCIWLVHVLMHAGRRSTI